jgi:hypothetical protein
VAAQKTFGTSAIDAIDLIESALNQKSPQVTVRMADGSRKVDQDATLAAREKQEALKDLFGKWVWKEPRRADRLLNYYNDNFNVNAEPKYDGRFLTLPGAATHVAGKPFKFHPHQMNAVWRALQQGNTLLAHVVGSGKTYTMAAIAVESKRMGFSRKPMQIVPNHMLGQFTREFRQLYPNAKLLIATKDEFALEDRRAFIAKAAAGDWDAVVMTHRSFESIPLSAEFQERFIQEQIDVLEDAIRQAKEEHNRDLTKMIEKSRKKLQAKLEGLLAESKKSSLLNFEEMGVDLLLVDEAHAFKNLQFFTKLRNFSSASSERAFDMYMKSAYLEQVNPGRGLIFATGTPVTNSLAEVYTMLRYLQPKALRELGMEHFDAWIAQYGRSTIELELNPTGAGYRMKERIARFMNVGDLAALARQTWDVQTAEMIKLKTPPIDGGKPKLMVAPATDEMKAFINRLGQRAEMVRKRMVDPEDDNFLKITTDGRHGAMDLRLVDHTAPARETSKVALAANEVYEIWKDTHANKGAQLVFSDISAPGSDPSHTMGGLAGFTAYDDLKNRLVALGVPSREIAFIHEADSDVKKEKLFKSVRDGFVRVLIGSTEKMGAGTNVQKRLVALHHLDAPWRPADIEQREGRILRQGNMLYDSGKISGVKIHRYVQEGSFDAYMWQTLERKAKFIDQFMRAGPETREMEDVDGRALDFAEIKAITSGDPMVLEKAGIDADVARLQALKRQHEEEQFNVKREISRLPGQTVAAREKLDALRADRATMEQHPTAGDKFTVSLDGKDVLERKAAGEIIGKKLEKLFSVTAREGLGRTEGIGYFQGFPLSIRSFRTANGIGLSVDIEGKVLHDVEVTVSSTPASIVSGMEHRVAANTSDARLQQLEAIIENADRKLLDLKAQLGKPFDHEAELTQKEDSQRLLNERLKQANEPQPSADAEYMDAGGDNGTEPVSRDPRRSPGQVAYGFADPFSAGAYAVYQSLKNIKQYFHERQTRLEKERTPLVESSFPEIEKRWEASRGVRPLPYSKQLTAAWEQIKKASRHFPEIDPRKDPIHALVNEQLLEVEHAKEWAIVVAHDKILQVVKDLTFAEVDLLTRALALSDIQKDVEAGLYDNGNPLPFGYTPEALDTDFEAVENALKVNKRVADALNRRSIFARELTTRLVELQLLPPEVMDDERYYHRQVMEYMESMSPGLGSKDVRVHRKGFQMRRVGGGDFNTAYQEAEFEWVSQAVRQIHMAESLEKIKQLADIKGSLQLMAKTANRDLYHKRWLESLVQQHGYVPQNVHSPLTKYAMKIAFSTNKIYNLVEQGILTPGEAAPFQKMLDSLEHDKRGYEARNLGKSKTTIEPFTFDHPQWWSFLKFLVDRGGPGAMPAATIFKAIREREAEIKTTLGRDYQTWETLIPDGYATFQPEEGNYFYRALTVEEKALEAAIQAGEGADAVKTREVWARGQDKPYWVIPEGIAATMEKFGRERDHGAIEHAWLRVISAWKSFVLLNPSRLVKYNLNNLSGDLDAALLYPHILENIDQAAADSYRFLVARNLPDAVRKEMQELVRLRVIGNTLTVAEIPDVTALPGFQKLMVKAAKYDPIQFLKLTTKYWRWARELTQVRENVLRIAAYRYFLKEIQAGRGEKLFGASNPVAITAEKNAQRRAAILARDLIGDYGSVSVAGQFARERLFPFFSWQEINARRYVNLFRNVAAEGGGVGRMGKLAGAATARGGLGIGFMLLKAAILANGFLLMVALWNRLMFPEEEKSMRQDNRSTHLIIGKSEDGSLRTVRIEGAFADFIDWLGLRDWPADVGDLVSGASSWKDKALQAAQAPVNKVAQMWEPVSKTLSEIATGKQLYPDAFHPRQIRDRKEYVAQQAALGWLYRKVMDIPQRPKHTEDWATGTFIYKTDPGEAAYYQMQDKVTKWNDTHGNEAEGQGEPTERASALYYWRKAAQWGAEEQADRWLQKYYELGGTVDGAKRSAKGGDPLKRLKPHDRRAFQDSLDDSERRALDLARDWWREDRVEEAMASVRRTPKPERVRAVNE